MEKEIKLPSVSEEEGTATVADIYVKEGDTVEEGQDLIAVDSDKASVDVPSDASGKVKSIKVKNGDEVNPGDVILVLETEGKEKSDEDKTEEDSGEEEEKKEEKKSGKDQKEEEEKPEDDDDQKDENDKKEKADKEADEEEDKGKEAKPAAKFDEPKSDDHEVPAAPLARKFARELGIDISQLQKDDPEARITREDVMNYAKKLIRGGGRQSTPVGNMRGIEPIEIPDFSQWGEVEKEPLSGIRTRIAENTRLSWQNIPHVTQHDKANMEEMLAFRQKLAKDKKISITALLVKITVEALRHFPHFNASLDLPNRELYIKKYYNISVAVDTENGLLMPVVKNADQKSVQELSDEIAELAEKARNRKLKADEMKGGNFAISNLGGIGGTAFTPVIFPPQVAILGVSSSEVEAVFDGEEFVPMEMLPLSLSYDHRAIDGADAARFLRWICDVIEQPFNLLAGK